MMPTTIEPPSAPPHPIPMAQKVSVVAFFVGAFAFFITMAHVLRQHSDWSVFASPPGVSDLCYVFAAVTLAVGGAFGINVRQIARAWTGTYTTRAGE